MIKTRFCRLCIGTACALLLAAVFFGCELDIFSTGESGRWISDRPFILNHTGQEIPHDNRIFESSHVLVYSDASSDSYKKRFSGLTEKALSELMADFNIASPLELGIVDTDTKLTVYTNKASALMQMAFPYGFVLWGEDSEYVQNWPQNMKSRYYNQIKHETTHVVQFMLGVLPQEDRSLEPDRWFNEGLAEYASGGFFIPITSSEQMNLWKKENNSVVPVSIHQWSDLPVAPYDVGIYYPMFHLAVSYLVHPRGMNRSLPDIKKMFLDMAAAQKPFSEAFEEHMGISLQEYEETFWERMDEFWD